MNRGTRVAVAAEGPFCGELGTVVQLHYQDSIDCTWDYLVQLDGRVNPTPFNADELEEIDPND